MFEIFGMILIIFALLTIIFGAWLLFRNDYCYRKTRIISTWVFFYQCLCGEDIDYDIDDYDTEWRLLLNPFRWTMRSMCNDKKKFDKLKEFVDTHGEDIARLKEELKEEFNWECLR